jgi:hypothetical protein
LSLISVRNGCIRNRSICGENWKHVPLLSSIRWPKSPVSLFLSPLAIIYDSKCSFREVSSRESSVFSLHDDSWDCSWSHLPNKMWINSASVTFNCKEVECSSLQSRAISFSLIKWRSKSTDDDAQAHRHVNKLRLTSISSEFPLAQVLFPAEVKRA